MKAASIRDLKKELGHLSHGELMEICLRLTRFKTENKELLTYLLFEASSENTYVASIKQFMDDEFELINTSNFFFIRKSIRKILRNVKKFIRYSGNKETEVTLLLYFCEKMQAFKPSIQHSQQLTNVYHRQLELAQKVISRLHEDLQYDYNLEVQRLGT